MQSCDGLRNLRVEELTDGLNILRNLSLFGSGIGTEDHGEFGPACFLSDLFRLDIAALSAPR